MKTLSLLAFPVLAFSQNHEKNPIQEAIPHIYPIGFQDSEVLIGSDGKPAGFVEGKESIEPNYTPPLPKRSKITKIEYGFGAAKNQQDFVITDAGEIDLIYRIFEQFSSKRTVKLKHYKITDNNEIEEVDLGDVSRLEMHLCTNGFRFYSSDELLLTMDSHTNDERFFGEGFEFINHPMVAYIKYKIKPANKPVDTNPVSTPR